MSAAENNKRKIDHRILNEILESLQQIDYGEAKIVIHDSKIVQMEKIEKKRFQQHGGEAYENFKRLHKHS